MHQNNAFIDFLLIIVFQKRKTKVNTTILRSIKRWQKSEKFILFKKAFRKIVRAIITNLKSNVDEKKINKIIVETFDVF